MEPMNIEKEIRDLKFCVGLLMAAVMSGMIYSDPLYRFVMMVALGIAAVIYSIWRKRRWRSQ